MIGGLEELGSIGRVLVESGGGDVGKKLGGAGLFDFLIFLEGDSFEFGWRGLGPDAGPMSVYLE